MLLKEQEEFERVERSAAGGCGKCLNVLFSGGQAAAFNASEAIKSAKQL